MKLFSKERRKNKQKLYSSRYWRRLSLFHRKHNPLCVRCLASGKYVKAEVADHDNPVWEGRGILTSKLNALCRACHTEKTFVEDLPKIKMAKKTELKFF